MAKYKPNFSTLTLTPESPPPTYSAWDLSMVEDGGHEAGRLEAKPGCSPPTYSQLSAPVLLKTMENASGSKIFTPSIKY